MKHLLLALSLVMLASVANANTITGVAVLKGSLKSKVLINGVDTTCKIKIERVRNLTFEDSYGNPGYTVRLNASLDGRDTERKITIKFGKYFVLTNMFEVGNKTEVRDLDYFSTDNTTMKIKEDGRLSSVTFLFNDKPVTCSF